MSHRQKIVYMQIGAITVAIFLALLVGAAALTKALNRREAQTDQKNAKQEQQEEKIASEDDNSADSTSGDSRNEPTTPEPTGEPVSITVSMVGDCTLGTDINFDQSTSFDAFYQMKNDPGYFFQNVKSIFSADDLTIANFEGTLTDSDTREDKTFAFKAPAEYAQILTSGSIEAVNTANNHSHDYGEQSYTDTLTALDNAGIIHFGYDDTAVMDIKGVKVGLVGIYELKDHLGREQQLKDNIAKVKADGAELVIVIFHWGNESETVPDTNQMTLGRLAIDEGADLVCGHHPHVLQGIEYTEDGPIVYSLGDFWFNDETKYTGLLNLEITSEGLKQMSFTPCEQKDSQTQYLNNAESQRALFDHLQEISPNITIDDTGVITELKDVDAES